MKRVISFLFAITLIFIPIVGCKSLQIEKPITEVKVTLPKSAVSVGVVEGEAVLSTQLYLLSRAYFEKLQNYDTASFNAHEYSELLADASEAFRIAEAFSASFEDHASVLAALEGKETLQYGNAVYELLSDTEAGVLYVPLVRTAFAADEPSAAVRYAQELTQTFDNAKNGQKLKAVAEKYGTDVKMAKAMLDQAQAILEGAAYEDQAAFENKCYEAAVETKAAASAIGFGVAWASTGGLAAGGASLSGIVEAGGLLLNGVSAVIDMGTAVTIHTTNGEGNEYTQAWEKTGELFAPVSAVFAIGGGIQNIKDFRNPDKAEDMVNNAAQAFLTGLGLARDYVQDGTILGVSSEIVDGYRQIMVRSAETANPEAVKELILKTGINEEALNVPVTEQTAGSGLSEAADVYIAAMGDLVDPENPLDTEAFLSTVDRVFTDALIAEGYTDGLSEAGTENIGGEIVSLDVYDEDVAEKPLSSETEPSVEQNETVENILPAEKVVGTYAFQGADDVWVQTVTIYDENHLQFTDDEGAVLVGAYDEKTGVFAYSEDVGDGFIVSARVTFTEVGSGVQAEIVLTIGSESAVSVAMKE